MFIRFHQLSNENWQFKTCVVSGIAISLKHLEMQANDKQWPHFTIVSGVEASSSVKRLTWVTRSKSSPPSHIRERCFQNSAAPHCCFMLFLFLNNRLGLLLFGFDCVLLMKNVYKMHSLAGWAFGEKIASQPPCTPSPNKVDRRLHRHQRVSWYEGDPEHASTVSLQKLLVHKSLQNASLRLKPCTSRFPLRIPTVPGLRCHRLHGSAVDMGKWW